MSIASEIAKMAASAKSESRHMATVLRTDQDGTVVCELTPLGVHVRN